MNRVMDCVRQINQLVLYAVFVGCSASSSKPPPPPPQIPHPDATCDTLACLQAFEGKVIDVEGTFVFPPNPKRKGQHLYRLTLKDDTSVVLYQHPAKLTRDIDGKRITARGVYYKHPMPERYGIIEATASPYLVEVYDIVVR
jgi:hypothetical protein